MIDDEGAILLSNALQQNTVKLRLYSFIILKILFFFPIFPRH